MIPYARQWVDEEDIRQVVEVLHSDWLTTGPVIERFERAVAAHVGAKYGVALSSGTAALHAAMAAAGVGPGDEVIVPAMTFAATANAVVYQGGCPVFADVDPNTLLIDPTQVRGKITSRTRAIVAVDYAGQPCDYDALRAIATQNELVLVADACHALGAEYKGKKVGSLADLTVFSFHPVKSITTGEGGMITTDREDLLPKIRSFRNHGITADHRHRTETHTWYYEMTDLGYNYRITDFQCSLGLSQLSKLSRWILRRQEIARQYDHAFAGSTDVTPLNRSPDVSHAFHLYVVKATGDRAGLFHGLRKHGIGVNVHYIPVHLHPFYRQRFGTGIGMCPVAEAAYERILSLPLFPSMLDRDVREVIQTVRKIAEAVRETLANS